MPTKLTFIAYLHRLRSVKIDARNFYAARIEAVADDDLLTTLRSLYIAKTTEIELLDLILLEADGID